MATVSSYGGRNWERHLGDPDEYGWPESYAAPGFQSDTKAAISDISRRFIESRQQGAQLALRQVNGLKKGQHGLTKAQMKENLQQINNSYKESNSYSMDRSTDELMQFIDDAPVEEAQEAYNMWHSFLGTIKDFMEEIKNAVIGALWDLLRFFGAIWEGLKVVYTEVKGFFVAAWQAFKGLFC